MSCAHQPRSSSTAATLIARMPPNTTMATDSGMDSPVAGASVRVPGPPQQRQAPDQLRVMVAGESGLGKASPEPFRHCHCYRPSEREFALTSLYARKIFFSIESPSPGEQDFLSANRLVYSLLKDTPGYGDHVNVSQSFQPVVDHIVNGNKRYLAEVMDGNETPEKDGRTDVCIYFIAAHRCKPIDIEYMKQLSKAVAVIPVIGKSDSMTVDEMKDFKTSIVDLAAQDKELEFFQFSGGFWSQPSGDSMWCLPTSSSWFRFFQSRPGRQNIAIFDSGIFFFPCASRYPWGTCRVMETTHSDNTYLQCLLLEVGFQDMKDEMTARYRAFVKEQTRPITEVTIGVIKSLPRRASYTALNVVHEAQGRRPKSVLALTMAAVCAMVAVMLAYHLCGVSGTPPISVEGMHNPPEGLTDWAKVIEKIQELEGWDRILAAVNSGEEHLDVLIDVLMEDYKMKHGAV
ncbi:unnamed protein product [Ectocarpus sp. 8 AP-2014]